jgi:hypothetical protein
MLIKEDILIVYSLTKKNMKLFAKNFFFFLFALVFLAFPARAEGDFPADAGFVSVRDFGAVGDGVHDDTAAINAALTASGEDTKTLFWQDKIVYFPNGIYLVSDRLNKKYADGRFASGAIMVGENRDKTIIKLKDNAENYQDENAPRAVIFTTAKLLDGSPTSGGKDYTNKGEGNDAYANFVENMTIDVGVGNAGAVGIDYLANNLGAIRNVRVVAGKDSGTVGISMARKWIGPALLSNVEVLGFDVGIAVDSTEYGITLDNVRLKGQKKIGLSNNHNVISANNLRIDGAPQKIVNLSEDGLIVQSDDRKKWHLTIKNALTAPQDASKKWASVRVENEGEDATEAVRKAFDSGASTIYFPHGIYNINENIKIPKSVQRIVGMMSTIRAVANRSPEFSRDVGFFAVNAGAKPITIEKLAFDNSSLGEQVAVSVSAKRQVVLRDIVGAGVTALKREKTGGEVFLENTCCGKIDIAGKAGVWARQLNSEGGGTRIINDGAPLWILGIKTERNCTILENKNGANSEIIGGLIYMVQPAENQLPAFINENAKFRAAYVEEAFNKKAVYQTHLRDIKNGDEREVLAETLPKRGLGRIVPMLSSE